MTINESDGATTSTEVGPKKIYIQLGDTPLGLAHRITSSQVKRDLGMTIPEHIGGILQSVQDRALYFLVNPSDHSTTGNTGIAFSYAKMFASFDPAKLQHVSFLPDALDSGTTVVCIFTNGNVSATLITDKPDLRPKPKPEST